MKFCFINTPLGIAQIQGDDLGISSVLVLDTAIPISENIPSELELCCTQLQEYFNGKRHDFQIKLNPKGTAFQNKVWQQLLQIPYGKTISYLQLAKQLGDAKTIRAVANANAKNPLWIIVPCHRVIGSNGSLTGYAGGLHRKQWLLQMEQSTKQLDLWAL